MPRLSDGDEQFMPVPAWLQQLQGPRPNVYSAEMKERLKGMTHRTSYVCFTCLDKSPNGTTHDKINMVRHSHFAHQFLTVVAELSFIKPSDEITFVHAPKYMCVVCDMPFSRLIDVPMHTCPLASDKVKST